MQNEGKGWKGKDGRGRWVVVWGCHCHGLLVPVLATVAGSGGVVIVVHAWAVVVVHVSTWAQVVVVTGLHAGRWWGAHCCPCMGGCGRLCVIVGACHCGHLSACWGEVGHSSLWMGCAMGARCRLCPCWCGCGVSHGVCVVAGGCHLWVVVRLSCCGVLGDGHGLWLCCVLIVSWSLWHLLLFAFLGSCCLLLVIMVGGSHCLLSLLWAAKKKTPRRICERCSVSVNELLEFLRAFLLSGKRSLDQINVRKVDEVQESKSLTK